MGTSLTPEFWERFTILLIAAVGVTIVLVAALDALAGWLLRRRAGRTPPRRLRPRGTDHRTIVHS
ncbi:hypothetical protein [Streptomyces sp. NPDC001652]|uniref:hypothetical protein n=1 Tax=Streptomyces sp. NPDC001652 TaxID=3154393 RepID=UPI0033349B6F